MSDLYPYCSRCDTELTEEERKLNESYENLFYPICNKCLEKQTKKIIEITNPTKEEE